MSSNAAITPIGVRGEVISGPAVAGCSGTTRCSVASPPESGLITQAEVRRAVRKAVANKMKKLERHIRLVEAKSNRWKLKYKSETGSLKKRIAELEEDLQATFLEMVKRGDLLEELERRLSNMRKTK